MDGSDPQRGGSFYEDDAFVETYLDHRHAPVSSPNLVMEDPAFMSQLGSLAGQRILDLGCGDGSFGQRCGDDGCVSYLGVDGSSAMIDRARTRNAGDERITFSVGNIEEFSAPAESADLVTSRMALHYVADLMPVLTTVRRVLAVGGRLAISVVHPVITAGPAPLEGQRSTVLVDDYFSPGPRDRTWFGRPIVWQHRTVEDYVRAIQAAGLELRGLREGAPVRELFDGDEREFERRQRVPLFLVLSAVRTED